MTEFQLIARTWPRIRDDVKLVFRHFPLDTHRFSFQASRYAEAAGRQGRFWEMHDLLFANQQAWSPMNDPAPLFEEYAAQLGLDIDQLRADIELPEVRAKIVADQQGGHSCRCSLYTLALYQWPSGRKSAKFSSID